MSLHLVEIPISLKKLHIWATQRFGRAAEDEGLALHHLFGEVFGPGILQPFRLMASPSALSGTIYAYAAQEAAILAQNARAVITPAHADVLTLGQMRSQPRPPTAWRSGQRLGFDLRIRPVVRLASQLQGYDEGGAEVTLAKGAEIDAYLATVLRGGTAEREPLYLDWLAARLAGSATLDLAGTRVASFQRLRCYRGGKRTEGPDAIVHGTLSITDPESFAGLLARGVGRHCSYGYGMLLLRPPQRLR